MVAQDYARTYRANSVLTASPGQLVLMLYDGALKAMAVAREAFALAKRHNKQRLADWRLIGDQAICGPRLDRAHDGVALFVAVHRRDLGLGQVLRGQHHRLEPDLLRRFQLHTHLLQLTRDIFPNILDRSADEHLAWNFHLDEAGRIDPLVPGILLIDIQTDRAIRKT